MPTAPLLSFLDTSITLVIIAHVVVSLLLILVIMMQRPKQEGLGAAFGSGMTDAAWGARTTDVLQKGTVWLGTLFFVFSLLLAILMGKRNSEGLGKRADIDGASGQTTEAAAVPEIEAPNAAEEFEKELEAATGEVVDDAQETIDQATEEATQNMEELENQAQPAEETPAPAE